ncbi:MAG TPA: ATP-binding protein [Anaerolineales bacterium]
MTPTSWAFLVGVSLLAAWLAWRLVRLQRGIGSYESAIGQDPRAAAGPIQELDGLTRAIRAFGERTADEILALGAERDRLAAVLDQMTDAVLIADAAGQIRYANPAVGQLFRIVNPLGRSVTEVLRNHVLVETWQRSRQDAALQSASVEIPTRQQFLQLIVMPDSHAGGSLLLAQDLTRVRHLETVRQDFVSNISHELRTPLASLRALAETLQDGALKDPQVASRFLDQMITEVDALTQMAEELLELSSIESGKADLRIESVHPKALLESAAQRMRLQAERAGLSMRIECEEQMPQVRADPARVEQVLVNLIHNAIKFTPGGGEVLLSAERSKGQPSLVRMAVHDTGRGISPDDLPRIFERFYRADRSRSKGGSGLGLSIARHIVEAHGGTIWAESTQGRGTTFFFTLAAQPASSLHAL